MSIMAVKEQQVETAVAAVLTLMKKDDSAVNIVDQPEKIDVQITLKKIPDVKHKNISLILPHSVHHDTREVCLFVKDLDEQNREYEETVSHYEDIFRKKDIQCISKIIPLKALRTDYSMYSAKRSLAKAYDLYLADDRVFGMLPGLLGKIFFAKKKLVPNQVNLSAKHLKSELEDVVSNTRLVLQGTGSSSCVTVAHSRLSKSEIVDNVLAACSQVAEKLPGGLENIKNIYIKGANTKSLPVYFDFGGLVNVDLPDRKETKIEEAEDEITTVEGARVKIRADGYVQIIKDETVGTVKTEDSLREREYVKKEESNSSNGEEGDSENDDSDMENVGNVDENDGSNKEEGDSENDDSDMENVGNGDENDGSNKTVKVAKRRKSKGQTQNSAPQISQVKKETKAKAQKKTTETETLSVKKEKTVGPGATGGKKASPSGKRNLQGEAAEEVVAKKKAKKTPAKAIEEKVKENITKKGKKARKV